MLKKLTIKTVADRMGICGQHLQRLETGKRQWVSSQIDAASVALGVRPFFLLMSPADRRRARRIFG